MLPSANDYIYLIYKTRPLLPSNDFAAALQHNN